MLGITRVEPQIRIPTFTVTSIRTRKINHVVAVRTASLIDGRVDLRGGGFIPAHRSEAEGRP